MGSHIKHLGGSSVDNKSGGGSYHCSVKKLVEVEVRKKMIVEDFLIRRGQA